MSSGKVPIWWPPGDVAWTCTAGEDCDEGWIIFKAREDGQADTAQRCRCIRANIRQNRLNGRPLAPQEKAPW